MLTSGNLRTRRRRRRSRRGAPDTRPRNIACSGRVAAASRRAAHHNRRSGQAFPFFSGKPVPRSRANFRTSRPAFSSGPPLAASYLACARGFRWWRSSPAARSGRTGRRRRLGRSDRSALARRDPARRRDAARDARRRLAAAARARRPRWLLPFSRRRPASTFASSATRRARRSRSSIAAPRRRRHARRRLRARPSPSNGELRAFTFSPATAATRVVPAPLDGTPVPASPATARACSSPPREGGEHRHRAAASADGDARARRSRRRARDRFSAPSPPRRRRGATTAASSSRAACSSTATVASRSRPAVRCATRASSASPSPPARSRPAIPSRYGDGNWLAVDGLVGWAGRDSDGARLEVVTPAPARWSRWETTSHRAAPLAAVDDARRRRPVVESPPSPARTSYGPRPSRTIRSFAILDASRDARRRRRRAHPQRDFSNNDPSAGRRRVLFGWTEVAARCAMRDRGTKA